MIDAQNKTITLYSYQSGIGANTEAILNRTLRHILYGDLYGGNGDNGDNGGNGGGEIPPIQGYMFIGGPYDGDVVTSLSAACAMFDQYWENNGGAWWGSTTAQQNPPACVSASGGVMQSFSVIVNPKYDP